MSIASGNRAGFGYHAGAFLQSTGPARFTPRGEFHSTSPTFNEAGNASRSDRLELPLLLNARIAGDLAPRSGAGPLFASRYLHGSEGPTADHTPSDDRTSLIDTVKAAKVLEPEAYWALVRQRKAAEKEHRRALAEQERQRLAAHRAKQDSLHPWSMPAHAVILLGGGVLVPTAFTYPLADNAADQDPINNVMHAKTTLGRSFGFGMMRWSAGKGTRPHLGLGLRFSDNRYISEPIEHSTSGGGSNWIYRYTYSGTAVLECVSVGVPVLLGIRPSERNLVYCGVELRLNGSGITETGTMTYIATRPPDLMHPEGITLANEQSDYSDKPSVADIASFQVVWQLGYQRTFAKNMVTGLQVEFSSTRLSTSRDEKGKLLDQGGFPVGVGLQLGWMFH